jgi:hypothetical protein
MKQLYFIGLILMVISVGCNTSKITNSWKSNYITDNKFKNILVLGLIRESDRSIQRNMENHLVEDLLQRGYKAESALTEYGPKAFDKIDEEAAIGKIKNTGVDAVITIVLLDKKKERKYIPGNIFFSPYGYYYNHFWGYRSALYNRIYEPGYYVTDTKYFWESNVYDMSTQKLVYSVQTESFDPSSTEKMGHEYGQIIIKDLIRNEVLSNSNGSNLKN